MNNVENLIKVKVIYNGINLKEYVVTEENATLKKYGIDQSKPFVLFVGRRKSLEGWTPIPEVDASLSSPK